MKRIKISYQEVIIFIKIIWYNSKLAILRKMILIFPFPLKNFVYHFLQLLTKPIKSKYNNEFLKESDPYLRIRLGESVEKNRGIVNLDFKKNYLSKKIDFVLDIIQLPYPDKFIELIEVYLRKNYFPKDILFKALHNWWDKLIPGGKLIVKYLDSNKGDAQYYSTLKEILRDCRYKIIEEKTCQNYSEFPKPYIQIDAYKSIDQKVIQAPNQINLIKREERHKIFLIDEMEKKIYFKLINELKKDFAEIKEQICVECGINTLEKSSRKIDYNLTFIKISKEKKAQKYKEKENLEDIQFKNENNNNLFLLDDRFDAGYAIKVIEYIEPDRLENFFSEIKRVLKPNGKFLVAIKYKDDCYDPSQRQFFTKSLLAEFLDKINLSFDWMELEKRGIELKGQNMLKAMIINKPAFQLKQKKKICAIGSFEYFVYKQLGFHWDGQMRAFRELGFETLLLDIYRNYENLRAKILEFSPDILWLCTKYCLPLIDSMKKDLEKIGCTIMYWFCDLRAVEGIRSNIPLQNLIINPKKIGPLLDYIFLSNVGQIQDYKSGYEVENVYYMPQACTPSFHHSVNKKKKYDITFVGAIGKAWQHKERTKLIRKISHHYDINLRSDVRNNIAELYSSSKIVFGADLTYGKPYSPYLCCSNRIFIALGCGAFYLCQYFPGLERLAENHKHLVWFKTEKELFELIDYYLSNDDEREKIRKNAEDLAHSKHTYVHRIQNILDIIDGKTKEFYGFLK